MTQETKPRVARIGASTIVIATLLSVGIWGLLQDERGYSAAAGVLIAAGAGLGTMVALAVWHQQRVPRWAKWVIWSVGVLGGIVIFGSVSPLAGGMLGASIGLLPFWARIEAWLNGADV